jgi:hypothetical protein
VGEEQSQEGTQHNKFHNNQSGICQELIQRKTATVQSQRRKKIKNPLDTCRGTKKNCNSLPPIHVETVPGGHNQKTISQTTKSRRNPPGKHGQGVCSVGLSTEKITLFFSRNSKTKKFPKFSNNQKISLKDPLRMATRFST